LSVGSWEFNFIGPLVAILPNLEQSNNYQNWDFSLSYTHPINIAVAGQRIPTYLCPSMVLPREVPILPAGEVGGPSSYLLCEGTRTHMMESDGLFGLHWPRFGFHNSNRRLSEVTDGLTHTFVAGETVYNYLDFRWTARTPMPHRGQRRFGTARWAVGYPRVSLGTTLFPFNLHTASAIGGFASQHRGGANFTYADGSVRFVGQSVNAVVYRASATRENGESERIED
jgi:prepilin-type processing-associated H-X9-DG protein